MYTAKLRAVGGSVMFAIPKALLEGLGLHANQQVGITLSQGRMIVEPKVKPRYSLSELMGQCDPDKPMTPGELEWLDAAPVGKEIL